MQIHPGCSARQCSALYFDLTGTLHLLCAGSEDRANTNSSDESVDSTVYRTDGNTVNRCPGGETAGEQYETVVEPSLARTRGIRSHEMELSLHRGNLWWRTDGR